MIIITSESQSELSESVMIPVLGGQRRSPAALRLAPGALWACSSTGIIVTDRGTVTVTESHADSEPESPEYGTGVLIDVTVLVTVGG